MKAALFTAVLLFATATSASAQADTYVAGWGPAPGATVSISASDQDGNARSLNDLSGEKGLVIFLNRSADW